MPFIVNQTEKTLISVNPSNDPSSGSCNLNSI
jgi:hypothetical protein